MATTTQTSPNQVRKLHIYGVEPASCEFPDDFRLCFEPHDPSLYDLDTVDEYYEFFADIHGAGVEPVRMGDEGYLEAMSVQGYIRDWSPDYVLVPIRITDAKRADCGETTYEVLCPAWEDR